MAPKGCTVTVSLRTMGKLPLAQVWTKPRCMPGPGRVLREPLCAPSACGTLLPWNTTGTSQTLPDVPMLQGPGSTWAVSSLCPSVNK